MSKLMKSLWKRLFRSAKVKPRRRNRKANKTTLVKTKTKQRPTKTPF